MLHSRLLSDTVQFAAEDAVLILNSAADPFVPLVAQQLTTGKLILAEDNVAALQQARSLMPNTLCLQSVPFHEYSVHYAEGTSTVAVINMLYQSGKAQMLYGLQVAAYALNVGGRLYVVGAKERGVLSMAKRMQALFGNVETLVISKGLRVLCSHKGERTQGAAPNFEDFVPVFAGGELDEGTRLLLEVLEVRPTDEALDIGCGAGFIGLHIARLASKGTVTLVDVSLSAVDMAQHMVQESGLTNVRVLPSDGAQAVLAQHFDLVVTNPPFHVGGIQTIETAERFIHEAAQVLRPRGCFYLVANRFLKYEPTLRACFHEVKEVGGDRRYKVLRAELPEHQRP